MKIKFFNSVARFFCRNQKEIILAWNKRSNSLWNTGRLSDTVNMNFWIFTESWRQVEAGILWELNCFRKSQTKWLTRNWLCCLSFCFYRIWRRNRRGQDGVAKSLRTNGTRGSGIHWHGSTDTSIRRSCRHTVSTWRASPFRCTSRTRTGSRIGENIRSGSCAASIVFLEFLTLRRRSEECASRSAELGHLRSEI